MSKRLRADLSLAFCTLLWGATFVVAKNALDHASVFIFLPARFSFGRAGRENNGQCKVAGAA
jgi:drug/metabolite transporter (DMT)-like permease